MSQRNLQRQLFDGFIRQTHCQRCNRPLHADQRRRYRTREAGLCFTCLRDFESSNVWNVQTFINQQPKEQQK